MKKQHKNYQDEDQKSAINKKLILKKLFKLAALLEQLSYQIGYEGYN